MVPRGDGDDQHYLGIDGGLDPWLGLLWEQLLKKYPLPVGKEPIPDTVRLLSVFYVTILLQG